MVCCPNANKPGICEHAAAQIKDFQVRRGRKHAKGTKRRSVNTLNWDDIPSKQRVVLLQRHHSGSVVTTNGGSIASSITGATMTCASGNCASHITLHQDVVVLVGTSLNPPIPIAIHSPMAHITFQTGTSNEEKDCPNLRCVFDTGAALSTANFHFMEAAVCQNPHILKRVYMPADYASIVLSGILTSSNDEPITNGTSSWVQNSPPLPYQGQKQDILLVATGPDVAVNHILGLPFIKAMGMIGNFVDNVCQAKHLLCNLFPIDFKCATKSIPVFMYATAPCNVHDTQDPLQVLATLRKLILSKSNVNISADMASISAKKKTRFCNCWVSPVSSASSVSSDANDYQHQVLGDLGYL